ncbi:MAG: glycosyltransferase family 92 protein [Selenomonadaceae bacterium]|nr:glycosyltransferase family 92 protein [Selenomonadaceae bacterium]
MAADKNLFLYDVAIVAILKNEGHYLKEWLDYHLLAGVDHFYLYDNESTDDYSEIIAPYVRAGLVTSKYFPGESMQFAAYDEAVRDYRFACRYMAFVDLDEFIYPKTAQTVAEVVDDILSGEETASGVAINW